MKFVSRLNKQIIASFVVMTLFIGFPVKSYAEEPPTFEFDSSTGTITTYNGIGGDVVIPAEIDGVAVEHIGDWAFYNKGITSVTIPDSVITIENDAFGHNQLTTVSIPDSVTGLGRQAFADNQLSSVTISKYLNNIEAYVFGNNQLTTVAIPEGLTNIGDSMFEDNQLTAVSIPNTVTIIENSAFDSNLLTEIIIPDSVMIMGERALYNNRLTKITMEGTATSIGTDILSYSNDNFKNTYAIGGAWTYIGTQTGTWEKELNDAEKISKSKAAIETAITNLLVSNTTSSNDVLTTAQSASLHGVTVAWDESSLFNKIDATNETVGSITGILNLTLGSENATIEINKSINRLLIIDQVDNITTSTLEVNFPTVTIRDSGEVVTGKNIIYTCDAITNNYGGTINHSDKIISLGEDTPNGTYTVTVSLEDNSALPITFDIILSRPYIVLTPESVELVRGQDSDFVVTFPAITVYDGEGNLLDKEYEIAGDDFGDYITGEPTSDSFSVSKEIPVGTYHLKYGIDKDMKSGYAITKDFTIVVRNPRLEYKVTTGGEITGDTIQVVEPGSSGTEVIAVTSDGYKFSKWSDGVTTASRTDENIIEDLTVTAEFDVNQHTVTFESNGGNIVDPSKVNYNSLVTSPTTPIKTGYTFVGWYKDSGLTTIWNFASHKVMSEDITLYAKWTRVSSSGSSGGSGSSGDSGGLSSNDDLDSSQNIEENKKQEENTVIIINGQEEKAGKESVTEESGEKVVEVTVDPDIINKKIEEVIQNQSQETNSIEVPISTQDANKITTTLTGDIVKKMDDNDFNLSIVSKEVNYVIPAKEVGIESVAKNLGVPTDRFKEIEIEVKINKIDEAIASEIQEKAKANGQEIVFPPVSFEIVAKTKTVTGEEIQVNVSNFNQYVKRVMKLPEGVDPKKVTTGIVYNKDGTFSHVPTKVFVKDGIYYAEINSLTNSSYSAIWNPITVESVNNHWSKEAVNDMASRLVIKNPETFLPDQAITRGEFAEYIVKALGIYRTGSTNPQKFSDVEMIDELANAIHIAYEYGIISGYPDGTFKPNAPISREEAMVMYSRAMDIVRLEEINNDKITSFIDTHMIAAWAYNDVKRTLSTGIFNGKTKETINPKDAFTCAEAVTAIRNLLVSSELIN